MKRSATKPLILLFVVLIAAFLSFSFWNLPFISKGNSFDSENVVEDIRVMSSERHSVAHPEARAKLRDYLVTRLEQLGADVSIYHEDSLEARGYEFDIDNIVADFPVEGSSSTLLMVAHYDSRYPWVPIRDTTCSYGAADDGYGVAVILETLTNVLKSRADWKQSLRVFFTDAEEVGMVGMKTLYAQNKELFEDVGLMINLEARGPFGPALLFETSPQGSKLVDFYSKHAKSHHTYSLTNVVYGFLPNFTDFTIVKDDIPGMNFSTIADINHYHTTLDNFENVNPASIDHYGVQVLPIVTEYLTGEEYSDKNYFRGGEDDVFFTIPMLGLFKFSKLTFIIVNVVLVLLMVLMLVLSRCKFGKAFKYAGITLALAIGALAFGLLLTWLGCLISGAAMKPFGVITGMMFDNALMIAGSFALLVAMWFFNKKYSSQEVFFGALLAVAILSLALLFAIGESMLFMIVFAFCVIAYFLYQLTDWKVFLLAGIALSCLHVFSFLYSLAMALTVGAFGAVLFIAVFDLMMIVPMCREYLHNRK